MFIFPYAYSISMEMKQAEITDKKIGFWEQMDVEKIP